MAKLVYPPEFEVIWAAYPARDGDNSKKAAYKAFRARVRGKIEPSQLLLAVTEYAKHCQMKGKTGTEFVMQAATFLGPNERWMGFIPKPQPEPEVRLVPAKEPVEPLIDARPFIRELLQGLAERKRSPLANYVRAK